MQKEETRKGRLWLCFCMQSWKRVVGSIMFILSWCLKILDSEFGSDALCNLFWAREVVGTLEYKGILSMLGALSLVDMEPYNRCGPYFLIFQNFLFYYLN